MPTGNDYDPSGISSANSRLRCLESSVYGSEMAEHVTLSKMELFCARALDQTEQNSIARHLSECSDCAKQLVAILGRQKGTTTVSFTLTPAFWLRHKHIVYEQLVEFSDNKLEAEDRELIDAHLETCAPCREDVQSFLAFRKQIGPEMEISYTPVMPEPARSNLTWWNTLARKPIYAAAVVLIAITLIIAGLFLKRRADNLQAVQKPNPNVNLGEANEEPTPDNRTANGSPMPDGSPSEKPSSTAPVIALNDRGGMVTVDSAGNVSGLDDVPASIRDEVAQALLTERIERASILKELGGQDATLRGSDSRQSFKLLFPARIVVVSDRPTFKWEKLAGASSYRVYLNGPRGSVVTHSEELSPAHTEWTISKPLKRGEIYTWTVVALVDGKEIVSPGPSSPEIKFKVLSANSIQRLNLLKKSRSHLALGVFYSREGMIAEAEREFQIVLNNNKSSEATQKLLRNIQLWKPR